MPTRPGGLTVLLSMLMRDKAALVSLMFLIVLGTACLLAPVLVGKSATKVNMATASSNLPDHGPYPRHG